MDKSFKLVFQGTLFLICKDVRVCVDVAPELAILDALVALTTVHKSTGFLNTL